MLVCHQASHWHLLVGLCWDTRTGSVLSVILTPNAVGKPPLVLRRHFIAERRPFGWMDTGSSDKRIDTRKVYRQGSAMHTSRAAWMVTTSTSVSPLTSPRCFIPSSKFTITSGPGLHPNEEADDALGTQPTFHRASHLTSLY